jgi:hypothetical protein
MEHNVEDTFKVDQERGYVEGNDWALPYRCTYLTESEIKVDRELFRHVNCSYLSTQGRPPTLAAIKKHAQSLAVLISTIAPSSDSGEVNNEHTGGKKFKVNEAFDWLNNLQKPYTTDELEHNRPLNALVNQVQSNSDLTGTRYHCPLEEPSVKAEDAVLLQERGQPEAAYQDDRIKKPYARHLNLLMHANEILEMLDHEFSATGGLLSILPLENEVEQVQFEDAKTTLVGQWLLYAQQMTARMHDLEIEYANCLDVLAGEAVIPMQHLSVHGPDGRAGREMVYPQDQWVLANVGDDVQTFLHQALDKVQNLSDDQSINFRARGATGDALELPNDGERGIVSVDLITRYYRIKGPQRGPIFILPAFADRPNTKYTRDLERRPTVVSVPEPSYPERVTEWEKKTRGRDVENLRLRQENVSYLRQVTDLTEENKKLKEENDYSRVGLNSYKDGLSQSQKDMAAQLNKLKQDLKEAQDREQQEKGRADKLRAEVTALAPNERSFNEVSGSMPRDVEGNITDAALKQMMQMLQKAADDNANLSLKNQALSDALGRANATI